MEHPFLFTERVKSFKYAFRGIFFLLYSQHNARIHAIATVAVIIFGRFFQISAADWYRLVIVITIVWMAELFNTAVELLADAVTNDFHPLIEKAKDTAAGGVLVSAIGAAITGLFIFYPYIQIYLKH